VTFFPVNVHVYSNGVNLRCNSKMLKFNNTAEKHTARPAAKKTATCTRFAKLPIFIESLNLKYNANSEPHVYIIKKNGYFKNVQKKHLRSITHIDSSIPVLSNRCKNGLEKKDRKITGIRQPCSMQYRYRNYGFIKW
jgi:hypothetical protein